LNLQGFEYNWKIAKQIKGQCSRGGCSARGSGGLAAQRHSRVMTHRRAAAQRAELRKGMLRAEPRQIGKATGASPAWHRGRKSGGDSYLCWGGGAVVAGAGTSRNANARPWLALALRKTGKEGRPSASEGRWRLGPTLVLDGQWRCCAPMLWRRRGGSPCWCFTMAAVALLTPAQVQARRSRTCWRRSGAARETRWPA
jgi:hypothetical protein